MSNQPQSTLKPDLLEQTEWSEAIAAAKAAGGGYHNYSSAFAKAANAVRENKPEFERTFFLLAGVASLVLQPDNAAEPYVPAMTMSTGRTMAEEDLGQEEITFLSTIAPMLEPPKLQARVGDILWRRSEGTSRYVFGAIALDAFMRVELDADLWSIDGEECWARAIELAYRTNSKAKLAQVCEILSEYFDRATVADGYYAMAVAGLLSKSRVPHPRAAEISARLDSLSHEFENLGDLWKARDYLLKSVRWRRRLGDANAVIDMHAREADLWQREAENLLAGDAARAAVAASHLESALKALLKIPRAERATRGIDIKIEQIKWKIRDAHADAVANMTAYDSPTIDLTDAARQARARVKGLNLLDALMKFVTVVPFASEAEARRVATERLNEPGIVDLVTRTVYTPDARVTARSAPTQSGDDRSGQIWSTMVSDYDIRTLVATRGAILPALSQLRVEHRPTRRDFRNIAQSSAIVPADREELFALALFHGFNQDFTSSLYILAPQMENLVRSVLKNARVSTTTFDADNIETENSLNALLQLPEATAIMGADLVYEIRALYCEQVGPNLRNRIAHGLFSDDESMSLHAAYAWWQMFRLVYVPYWDAYRERERDSEGE